MKKWLEVIGGTIAIIVGIWLIVLFAPRVLTLIEGIGGIVVGVGGGIALAIGISELKEKPVETVTQNNKKEKEEEKK